MACRMQMLNASTIYVSKPENRLLERPWHRWEDNIKMDLMIR
jgi:hypothetical protein